MRQGMSQNKLADLVGINKGTMSKIVNGDWSPTSYVKIRMSKILEIDSLVLFGDSKYFQDYEEHYLKIEEVRK